MDEKKIERIQEDEALSRLFWMTSTKESTG